MMSTDRSGCLPIRDNEGDGGALSKAFMTLLIFSFLLLIGPILSFFVTKHYVFEAIYEMKDSTATIYAAIVAVVLVHVVVGLFIYVAWKESNAHTIPPAFKQD